jgi:SAM-dependent methyltransferase
VSSSTHHPSPRLFFETAAAYQQSRALHAAVELDLFTAIAVDGSVDAVAARCSASQRGVRILCDSLTIMGFLEKTGDTYAVTPDTAAFLVSTSPAYIGGTLRFLHSATIVQAFDTLTEAVRTGGTALPEQGTTGEANPVWVDFAIGMMPMVMPAANGVAESINIDPDRFYRVLDIAAGHGLYGIKLAQKYPNVEVVALDWPDVVKVAQENAANMGVGDRHSAIPGSAFDADFDGMYDIVLLTNFLHHFDLPTCETLLRRVFAALNPGGTVLTVEFVPNDDRVTPPDSAGFSLVMLASTPRGDAYTFAELQSMFSNAGFEKSEITPIPHTASSIITSYKA